MLQLGRDGVGHGEHLGVRPDTHQTTPSRTILRHMVLVKLKHLAEDVRHLIQCLRERA
jgi:hypothetical protein